MTRNEAFDTIVTEFAKDMHIGTRRGTQFNATAKNGATYTIKVSFRGKDYITGDPLDVAVHVHQGPHLIHAGQWHTVSLADRAAQVALATIRNTEYTVQGELL